MEDNYALHLLKNALRSELTHVASARDELDRNRNGLKMNELTIRAFKESKSLGHKRIPELLKAIDILTPSV